MNAKQKSVSYMFTYDGDFKSLDTLTVLHSQINFVTILSEIKDHIHPELKLDFKIKGVSQGSLNIQHLVDVMAVSGLFVIEHYEYISNIFQIFGDIVSLMKFLKGQRAEKTESSADGNIYIWLDGDNITVHPDAFKIYQNSPIITNSLNNTGKLLSENEDIDRVQVTDTTKKNKFLEIEKDDFKYLSESNPYLQRTTDQQTIPAQHLYIKKPNLFPENKKKWVWELIHRGRDIKAIIDDPVLLKRINGGLRIGQGDRLIADLKIHYKFDERYNTFIESGKYEVFNVTEIRPRDTPPEIGFEHDV